jgi:Tfp pilus assembly protein PilF
MGKTSSAVTGMFGGKSPEQDSLAQVDPLSLANKPKAVDPEVFVANGQLWESTGDMNKAMESYTKALEQDPKNGAALTSIARLHFRENKFQEAAGAFRLAIAQNPNDAGLYNDLGLTLSKLGDFTNATASLEKSLELAPGTSRYANNLATIHFENGNPAGAFQVLEKNNKPAVAHFNMAYLHYKNGQVSQARNQLNQALAYKSQVGEDAVVQRAVERSHDMLAQIDGAVAPIAQAAPQATIAGGRFLQGPSGAPVRQTSQSTASTPGTKVAAPPAPTMTTSKVEKSQPTPKQPAPPQTTPTQTASANVAPAEAAPVETSHTMDLPKSFEFPKPDATAKTSEELLPKKVQWGKADTSAKTSPSRPLPVKPSITTGTAPKSSTESKPDDLELPVQIPSGTWIK